MVNAPEYNLNDPYTLNYDDDGTEGARWINSTICGVISVSMILMSGFNL